MFDNQTLVLQVCKARPAGALVSGRRVHGLTPGGYHYHVGVGRDRRARLFAVDNMEFVKPMNRKQ
jgi:hypothetical protein